MVSIFSTSFASSANERYEDPKHKGGAFANVNQAEEIKRMKLRVLAETGPTSRYPTDASGARLYLNKLLNDPQSSGAAGVLTHLLTLSIVGSVIVIILQSCEGYKDTDVNWFPVELVFTVFFTLELGVRCAVQYDTIQSLAVDTYFYIDFLAVLPFFVEAISGVELPDMMKALRIVRLFKLARQFSGAITLFVAVQDSFSALTVPAFFLMISACFFGVLLYYLEKVGLELEPERPDPAFRSIPEAIWFVFVTMTTVGYGDIYPNTTVCRIVNVIMMLFGVLFLSMPLAILGNNFCQVWQNRDRVTLIARIREELLDGGTTKGDVKSAFEKIDLDKSGSLNFKEFVVAIQVLRIDMTLKKAQKLWKSIDTDNSGKIMVEEFAELVFPEMDDIHDQGRDVADVEEDIQLAASATFSPRDSEVHRLQPTKRATSSPDEDKPSSGLSSAQLLAQERIEVQKELTRIAQDPKSSLDGLTLSSNKEVHLERENHLGRTSGRPLLDGAAPVVDKMNVLSAKVDTLTGKMDRVQTDIANLNNKLNTITELLHAAAASPGSAMPA